MIVDRIVIKLFENVSNDVIESRKWVEAKYPRDDLVEYQVVRSVGYIYCFIEENTPISIWISIVTQHLN